MTENPNQMDLLGGILPKPNELLLLGHSYRVPTAQELDANKSRQHIIRTLHASGVPLQVIADGLQMGVSTVMAFLSQPAQQDAIAAEKKRASAHLMAIARLGYEAWQHAISIGTVKPESIPVGVGIFIDKAQLLAGDPTSITETHKSLDRSDIERYLQGLRECSVPAVAPIPIDSESTDTATQPLESQQTDNK